MSRNNAYSVLVTWAKVSFPLLAIALLSTLFLVSRNPDPDAALPFAEVDVDQIAREQRLTEPRFAGTLGDGRALVLTADAVSSAVGPTDVINTVNIDGRMDLSDNDFLLLSARYGAFDMASQSAWLTEGVVAETSQGYRVETTRMRLSLSVLALEAPEEVRVTAPGLSLTAGGMTLGGPEDGAILSFTGGVRMIYDAAE